MLFRAVNLIIDVLVILIIVRAILSWIPQVTWRYREVTRLIERITEPLLEPFRRMLPPRKTSGLDLSPVLAIIALQVARYVVLMLLVR